MVPVRLHYFMILSILCISAACQWYITGSIILLVGLAKGVKIKIR